MTYVLTLINNNLKSQSTFIHLPNNEILLILSIMSYNLQLSISVGNSGEYKGQEATFLPLGCLVYIIFYYNI